MIAALQVRDSFTHADLPLLESASRMVAAEFLDNVGKTEFFYYLKANDKERWYFIRIQTSNKEKFVKAMESFAGMLGFRILSMRETKELLFRIDLNKFV